MQLLIRPDAKGARRRLPVRSLLLAGGLIAALALVYGAIIMPSRTRDAALKGYDIAETGLVPKYPEGCSPLTSLYASWTDVDGSERDEAHSGVDGGRLGEAILAPGPGVVRAVWVADWGWGAEGALLIRHSAGDLNVKNGAPYYYSAFYHLNHDDLLGLAEGQHVERGQMLARVHRPGGKRAYLPEVHWEVYEVGDDDALRWHKNERGRAYFTNRTSRLIDPLYLMSRQPGTLEDKTVTMAPFRKGADYAGYRGFTYILPCAGKVEDRMR